MQASIVPSRDKLSIEPRIAGHNHYNLILVTGKAQLQKTVQIRTLRWNPKACFFRLVM